MRKLITILLALCLGMGLTAAWAEDTAGVNDVTLGEPPFVYQMVAIEGTNFLYGVPQDWAAQELSEDDVAFGYIGRWQSPDGKTLLEVALEDLTEDVSLSQMAEMMANWTAYSNAVLGSINGRELISFEKPDDGIHGFFTMLDMEGDKPLLLRMDFTLETLDTEAAMTIGYIAGLVGENADAEAGTEGEVEVSQEAE